jgi:antitoxin ParD1/3/4
VPRAVGAARLATGWISGSSAVVAPSGIAVILSGRPALPYNHAMDTVTLPPELQRFAIEAVAAGRYRDLSELVAAGVSLLQRQEQARAELLASVLAAEEEADRDGYLTADDMMARVEVRLAQRRTTQG